MLKVVLLGAGELAQSLLFGLVASRHELAGFLPWEKNCRKTVSRKIRNVFAPDVTTSLVNSHNLYEIKAKYANSEQFKEEIKKINPDVIIVASWGEILKKEIIDLPKIACINLHPSLLPVHRGSNPFVSVIRQGEQKTGATFHLMTEGIDAGEILLQAEVEVSGDDTGDSLRRKVAFKAKELLPELLDKLERSELIPQKQDESKATYYPRIIDDDAKIDWNKPAQDIHNQIRALNPWLKCYTLHEDQFLYIKSTKIVNLENPVGTPGKILHKNTGNLIISTSDKDRAIMAEDIEAYHFLGRVATRRYLKNKINVGDVFREV